VNDSYIVIINKALATTCHDIQLLRGVFANAYAFGYLSGNQISQRLGMATEYTAKDICQPGQIVIQAGD